MSIFPFLLRVLGEAKVAPALIATIVILLALSYMIFQQTLLMQEDIDQYNNVLALGWYAGLERILKALNELLVAYFIMLPVQLMAEKLIVEAFIARSPASLLLMKENAYALKSAALQALKTLVENSMNVLTPILLLVSRGAALSYSLDGMQLIVVVACLTSVFMAGFAIMVYDHKRKEVLSKKETEVEEQARTLMVATAIIVINGAGNILLSLMTKLKREEALPSTKHYVMVELLYGLLEIATTVIPVALVWVLKGKDAFLPLYIVIQPMFWNSWYLFFTIKSLVVSTAPWAQFAEFIANSTPPPANLPQPSDAEIMMPIFANPGVQEVKLIGPSGCGKTTLMKKIIAGICNKFVLGYILYIDQFAGLPSGLSIEAYFTSAFPEGILPEGFEEELLRRAELLGIANVINRNTLKNPFSNPSGGERKRIIVLKYILPILMNSSKVMIAFLDEVSAGLDDLSFAKVREMIEEVKKKGVKVVSIDHHEHNGVYTLDVEVFKREEQIPHPPTHKVLSLWQRMKVKFFPHVYHKEEDESVLELGEAKTYIVVWAPALGMVEP